MTSKVRSKLKVLGSVLFVTMFCMVCTASSSTRNYSRLLEFIRAEKEEGPSYPFNDFVNRADARCQAEFVEYLRNNPQLLKRIQQDLDGEELRWRLSRIKQRLLYVPEERQEYAQLLESYCREVIQYVLRETRLDDPYDRIETLVEGKPKISDNGVTAFLVHNLAKESIATYQFANHKNKSLDVDISSKTFLGEVGSYVSHIYLNDEGTFEFVRDNYTIWQSTAKNPYTVLMVPVEETLHIAVRDYTHAAILEQIEAQCIRNLVDVKKVVEEWIMVEEALVGGLVRVLLPAYLKRHMDIPFSLITDDLNAKEEFDRYGHLRQGISLVESLGCQEAIRVYAKSPKEFRKLLQRQATPHGNEDAQEKGLESA